MTINNDTVYSMAQLDLSVGPVALHVPDTAGRYYVLQFVDAWTNNFAYVGHRATGTAEGDFLLVPPGWDGERPDGHTVIRFPTTVASIVGRWAVASDDDLPAVHALQDATTLTPVDADADAVGLAAPDPAVPDELMFLEKLRVWSQQFPPADRDKPLQESLAPLGIDARRRLAVPRRSRRTSVASLAAGLEEAKATLHQALVSGHSPEVNGWKLTFHAFDYNLDFFEVGALDDDRFKIADPKLRIVERAAAAIGGLWGNHPYEAAYIMTYVDDRGEQLNGAHTYTLRLEPDPAGQRVLVAHDVLRARLLPGRQPDRPLLDRRPHARRHPRRRRRPDHHHQPRTPHRREGSRQLAAQPGRRLPARHAHVRTRRRDPRPDLRVPRHHARVIAVHPAAPHGGSTRRFHTAAHTVTLSPTVNRVCARTRRAEAQVRQV